MKTGHAIRIGVRRERCRQRKAGKEGKEGGKKQRLSQDDG